MTGEFLRVFQIRQVFMISEDGNQVGSSLEMLFPFSKGRDDSQKLLVIDIIVSFHEGESLGKVSARMKVS